MAHSDTEATAPGSDAVQSASPLRLPTWVRRAFSEGERYATTARAVHGNQLHTVCEEARCPNQSECWSRGAATFMLLGDICTRACGFCAVKTGRPGLLDRGEPERVAAAVASMCLRYVVLTSVNRDDLPDGGAGVFAQTLRSLRRMSPVVDVELLTPDFRNVQGAAVQVIREVLGEVGATNVSERPSLVWGHNLETVPRLYRQARKGSRYTRSLDLLTRVAAVPGIDAKSALMLGLGETREEVVAVMEDLRSCGVRRLSLGQYLRPSRDHLPVVEYVHPDAFSEYEWIGRSLGFGWIKAGPLVRSSYHADEIQKPS
ncbi:MAG: lipoyl synthase [Acidiferrobacterales bacterium]